MLFNRTGNEQKLKTNEFFRIQFACESFRISFSRLVQHITLMSRSLIECSSRKWICSFRTMNAKKTERERETGGEELLWIDLAEKSSTCSHHRSFFFATFTNDRRRWTMKINFSSRSEEISRRCGGENRSIIELLSLLIELIENLSKSSFPFARHRWPCCKGRTFFFSIRWTKQNFRQRYIEHLFYSRP